MKNVFFDSKLTTIEEAKIPINSLAFTLGASVFEAVRVFYRKNNDDYILLNVKKHVERLFQSMKLMRMYPSFNKNDVVHGIEQLISECNTKNNGYIRITAYVNSPSPGSSVYDPKNVTTMFCITYMEKGQLPEYLEGIHCCTSSWTRISDNVLPPRAKSACNYENTRLAGFEAIINGYDNAILLNPQGKVSEAAESAIFFIDDEMTMHTPSATSGILESINRSMIINICKNQLNLKCLEREVDRTELYLASEVFLCNTAKLIQPVLSIDRLSIGEGKVGDITSTIWKEYLKVSDNENENNSSLYFEQSLIIKGRS